MVSENWQLKPGIQGSIDSDGQLFSFLLFYVIANIENAFLYRYMS